ncbi:MAG: TolC family protein [Bacteroidia bacterium]|nr:TolC family protein [Bacteroidia bacterium]
MLQRPLCLIAMLMLLAPAVFAQDNQDDVWSLRRCLQHAQENNLTLKQARLSLQSNEIDLDRNRASRLPNLNAGVGFGSNFGYTVNPFTNEFTSQSLQSLNAGLQSSVTIYNFGRITQTIEQSEVNRQSSSLDLLQAEYDLMLNVTLAYLDVIRNQELVQSSEIQVTSTKEQRDRTARLVEAGSIPRADLLQIEAQIATDELTRLNSRNQLETSYLTLMQLLQLSPSDPFGILALEVEIPENDVFETETEEIYEVAEQNMPFIKSADMQVRSAQLGEGIARTGLLPSISVSGSVGTGWASGRSIPSGNQIERNDTTSIFASLGGSAFQEIRLASTFEQTEFIDYTFSNQVRDNVNASVNLNLNIPIYNRKQNSAAIQQASISRQRAELNSLQQRQQLEQDIQQAYVAARNAYGTYTSTLKQIEALELALLNTERQFNLGAANSVEYLLSKNNLERARIDLVQAKYSYIFRAKILDFYLGKPLDF